MGAAICNVAVPFTNVLKRWTAFLQRCTTLDKVYQCCTTWNAQLCYNVAQRCITFGNVVTALNSVVQRLATLLQRCTALYNVWQRCTALDNGSVVQLETLHSFDTTTHSFVTTLDNVWQRCDNIAQRWITFGNVVQLPSQRCTTLQFTAFRVPFTTLQRELPTL